MKSPILSPRFPNWIRRAVFAARVWWWSRNATPREFDLDVHTFPEVKTLPDFEAYEFVRLNPREPVPQTYEYVEPLNSVEC